MCVCVVHEFMEDNWRINQRLQEYVWGMFSANLQCVAVCCSVELSVLSMGRCIAVWCSVVQHVAV